MYMDTTVIMSDLTKPFDSDSENWFNYNETDISYIKEAIEHRLPIVSYYGGKCREGVLYEVANSLLSFNFLSNFYPYRHVKIVLDSLPYGNSRPYIDNLYGFLNAFRSFDYTFDDNQTIFTCFSGDFNVPFYSCIIYLIKYGYDIFGDDFSAKNTLSHSDLYTVVELILNDEPYNGPFVAYSIWLALKYNNFDMFKIYDSTYGNFTTGIADNVMSKLSRGFTFDKFVKFNKEYNINSSHYSDWLSYLFELNERLPYTDYRLKRYKG